MWSQWANGHGIAHVQAKTIPMDLIWTESVQWLLINGVHRVPRAPAHVVPISKWPQCHTYTGKMVPMNMIWSESAPWLQSSSIYPYCDTDRVEAIPKCWHFAVDNFKCIFLNENHCALTQIPLMLVPIDSRSAVVQVLIWVPSSTEDKPLP